jgi:hypothetical protein
MLTESAVYGNRNANAGRPGLPKFAVKSRLLMGLCDKRQELNINEYLFFCELEMRIEACWQHCYLCISVPDTESAVQLVAPSSRS